MAMRTLLALVLALCLVGAVHGRTWYISPSGSDSNAGSSQAPFLSLSAALSACGEGDTIAVANGVYTGSDNVGLTFTTNVTVVGESLSTVFQANTSIGTMFTVSAEVHFSTMTIFGVENTTTTIGIYVSTYGSGGSVEGVVFGHLKQGIYYSSFWDRASVKNCTFQSSATSGISAYTTNVVSVGLTVDGCLFQSDSGISINPTTNGDWEFLTVADCSFENSNLVMLRSLTPTESVTIENCQFVGTSDSGYGAIYLYGLYPTITMTSVTVTDTQVSDHSTVNVATSSSGFFGNLELTDCWFSNNSAGLYTAGLQTNGYGLTIKECGFVGNAGQVLRTDPSGNSQLALSIQDTVFYANDARSQTNAIIQISGFQGEATISDSFFVRNKGTLGSGLVLMSTEVDVTSSYFLDNESTGNGGAIYVTSSANVTVTNSMLVKNTAWSGGAVATEYHNGVTLSRSILAANSAADNGGAIYAEQDSFLSVSSCLIMGNYAPNGGGWFLSSSSGVGEYLVVRRNNASIAGGGFGCDGSGTTDVSSTLLLGNYAPKGSAYACTGSCQTTLSGVYVAPDNTGSGCSSSDSVSHATLEQESSELEAELSASLPQLDMDSFLARIEARIGALNFGT